MSIGENCPTPTCRDSRENASPQRTRRFRRGRGHPLRTLRILCALRGKRVTSPVMSRFTPADLNELRDAVAEALAAEEPLEVVGGGSKRGLGGPLQTPHTLDLSRLAGIRDYAP